LDLSPSSGGKDKALLDITDIWDIVSWLRLKKSQCFGDWICLCLQVVRRKGRPAVLVPQKAALSKGPTQSFLPLPLPPDDGD
jgi:hypothetical protein